MDSVRRGGFVRVAWVWVVACLAGGAALVRPVGAAAQEESGDDELRDAARARYLRGRELLGEGDAVGALQEFAASYQLYPHWATLYGMAMCQDAMGRLRDAARLYQRVLREGGDGVPASERSSIASRIAEIEAMEGPVEMGPPAGRVTLRGSPEGAFVRVDGEDAGALPLAIDLTAGSHRVEVRADGYVAETRWVAVPADGDTTEEFALVPVGGPPSPQPPPGEEGGLIVTSDPPGAVFVDGRRVGTTPTGPIDLVAGAHDVRVETDDGRIWSDTIQVVAGGTVRADVRIGATVEGVDPAWFWTTAALAGAFAVGGAATGGYVLSLEDEYYDPATSPSRRDEIKSTGDPLRIVTDVLFGAAAGCAVGATTLLFFTDFGGGGHEVDVSILPEGGAGAAPAAGVPVGIR